MSSEGYPVKFFLWLISITALIAFQGSVLNPFALHGIRPDFMLIAVYFLGLVYGDIFGGIGGAVIGFVMDIISGGPVYYNIFTKFFSGYLAGVIERWVKHHGFMLHTGVLFLLSLVQSVIVLITYTFLGTIQFPDDLFYVAIPQAVFDGLAGGVVYLLLFRKKKDIVSRWESFVR